MQPINSLTRSSLKEIFVDPLQTNCRIDKFLISKLPAITRTSLQLNIRKGHIKVNHKHVKPNYKIKTHDMITMCLPKSSPSPTTILPENISLDIVYEDDDLLVVNKPAHMVVHPACENWSGTLVNALLYHYKKLPAYVGNELRPGLVHRIDKGTSGLLVIAKNKRSLDWLSKQFMRHAIERSYLALVWGMVQKDKDTIAVPLQRSIKDRRIVQACEDPTAGKPAITHYQVLKRLGYVTLLKCTLETGRTHQIRAHMKYLGHPLFGDMRYGGDDVVQGPPFAKYKAFVYNCFKTLPHQALHAETLGFIHPSTQKKIYFHAPAPKAFQEVIDKWERYAENKK